MFGCTCAVVIPQKKKPGTIISLQSPDEERCRFLNNDYIPWGILRDNKMVVVTVVAVTSCEHQGSAFLLISISSYSISYHCHSFIHSQSIRISFSQLVGRRFSRSVSQIVHTTVSL